MKDIIIIGAGIAGLSAAIYCARAGIDFAVLEQDGYGGGQLTSANLVENYPGFKSISGQELTENIRNHAVSCGTEIKWGTVENIINKGDTKDIILESGEVIGCKSVIAATGARPKRLGVAGEERLLGKGVSYCALCDGPFFLGKKAFVIGGGDSAVEDAIYLSNICSSVTIVHRRDKFRAVKKRIEHMKHINNIEIRTGENLSEITGDKKVEGVYLISSDYEEYFETDCVFIAIGTVPTTEYLIECGIDMDNNYVVANENCITNIPGIFVAGDIRRKKLNQAITAASDGANAAYSAIEYLKG